MVKNSKEGMSNPIKIMAQEIKPMQPEAIYSMPSYWKRQCDFLAKPFLGSVWVDAKDIQNRDMLSFVVRKWFGFGEFNLYFWNRYQKNSEFNPKFKCLVQRGKPCNRQHKCRIWKRHKRGWSCLHNPKWKPNWSKRAKLKIIPGDYLGEIDFEYIWNKRFDKMHYFWFWRDTKKRREST